MAVSMSQAYSNLAPISVDDQMEIASDAGRVSNADMDFDLGEYDEEPSNREDYEMFEEVDHEMDMHTREEPQFEAKDAEIGDPSQFDDSLATHDLPLDNTITAIQVQADEPDVDQQISQSLTQDHAESTAVLNDAQEAVLEQPPGLSSAVSFTYPVVLIFNDIEYDLFPETAESDPGTYCIYDPSLASQSFQQLFRSLRTWLADELPEQYELEANFFELELNVKESMDCAQTSCLQDVVEVFELLTHQDSQGQRPLYVELHPHLSFNYRLERLRNEAADGKHISELDYLPRPGQYNNTFNRGRDEEDTGTPDPETDHHQSFEQLAGLVEVEASGHKETWVQDPNTDSLKTGGSFESKQAATDDQQHFDTAAEEHRDEEHGEVEAAEEYEEEYLEDESQNGDSVNNINAVGEGKEEEDVADPNDESQEAIEGQEPESDQAYLTQEQGEAQIPGNALPQDDASDPTGSSEQVDAGHAASNNFAQSTTISGVAISALDSNVVFETQEPAANAITQDSATLAANPDVVDFSTTPKDLPPEVEGDGEEGNVEDYLDFDASAEHADGGLGLDPEKVGADLLDAEEDEEQYDDNDYGQEYVEDEEGPIEEEDEGEHTSFVEEAGYVDLEEDDAVPDGNDDALQLPEEPVEISNTTNNPSQLGAQQPPSNTTDPEVAKQISPPDDENDLFDYSDDEEGDSNAQHANTQASNHANGNDTTAVPATGPTDASTAAKRTFDESNEDLIEISDDEEPEIKKVKS